MHLFALLCLIILLSPLEAPAQDKLLFALAYGKIYLADISDDGMNIQNIRYLTKGYHPSWSPDGRRISFDEFSQSGNIYVMNLDDKTPHLLIRGGAETDWSPDGERIAFLASKPSRLCIADARGKILQEIPGIWFWPRWSPDGESLASVNFVEESIFILDMETGERRQITARGSYGPLDWSWSKNLIAYMDYISESKTWDIVVITPEGKLINRYHLGPFFSPSISWSPRGDHIIFLKERVDSSLPYVLDLRTGEVKSVSRKGQVWCWVDWLGGYTAVRPLNLLNTLWSLIKRGEVK